MSGEPSDGFLARWSRRKAASREAAAPAPPEIPEAPPPDLPPIESLGADSDYTVFLARGVSRAVQAQALGIAWATDPEIANFRGMAEYAWDFNAPGYGALAPSDNAVEWLSQVVRSGSKMVAAVAADAPIDAAPQPLALPEEAKPAIAADMVVPPAPRRHVEMEATPLPETPASGDAVAPLLPRRRHGGALPV